MAAVEEEKQVKASSGSSGTTKQEHKILPNVEDALESESFACNASADTDHSQRSGKRAKVEVSSMFLLSAEEIKATTQCIDSNCESLIQSIQLMPLEVQAAWMTSDCNTRGRFKWNDSLANLHGMLGHVCIQGGRGGEGSC
jgi:hypothetical protein